MGEVVVLGGYGSVGRACVRELFQTTSVGLVIAGRNAQRAERAALEFGERGRGVYADAADPRTLGSAIPGSAAVLCCAGVRSGAALRAALEHRVPFVDLAPLAIETHVLRRLREEAWSAQIPVVLHAGAVPGLPAIVADFLLRCFPSIHRLEISSTGGPALGPTAREDLAALRLRLRSQQRPRGRARLWSRRCRFPDPIGRLPVQPACALDLEELEATHCLGQLGYSEVNSGRLPNWLRRPRRPEFGLVAEAFVEPGDRIAGGRVAIRASDPLAAAAAVAGAVVRAVLLGRVPAGVVGPHEAINPARLLQVVEKRGVRVVTENHRSSPGLLQEAPASPRIKSRSGRIPRVRKPPPESARASVPSE